MIVQIVDEDRIFAIEDEGQTPVSAYRNRPVIPQLSLQTVKLPAGCTHILGLTGVIQHSQLQPEAIRMFRLNSRKRSGAKEPLETLMFESPDHTSPMYRIAIQNAANKL